MSFSAPSLVSSPIQAVSSFNKAIFSPRRVVAFWFTCSVCKLFSNDERLLPAKWFCNGEKLWRTLLKVSPLWELAAPPIQGAARGGRETNTVAVLPPAASTVSTPTMEISVYISRFQYWLYGLRFLSMVMKGVRPRPDPKFLPRQGCW